MLRRTLTILAICLVHAGCSTCSIWDECEPGDVRSCDYEGCGDCQIARQVCQDNHQWGRCECVSGGYDSYTHDLYDPHHDISLEPDIEEETDLDTEEHDVEDLDLEDGDLSDMETSDPSEDEGDRDAEDPGAEEEDAPEDGGGS
ncbi:MAG: hypothetical protein JRG91_10545 [Deltaproteobacteria bacterium]|nr:hypothetical protein [Deltaproteobacteria bacterium]